MYEQVVQFLYDVRSELRKVTFPSRKETLASTAVVIVVVFLIATYLGLIDVVLSMVITKVLR
jgi:preprotein translocase subunit SecE